MGMIMDPNDTPKELVMRAQKEKQFGSWVDRAVDRFSQYDTVKNPPKYLSRWVATDINRKDSKEVFIEKLAKYRMTEEQLLKAEEEAAKSETKE